MAWSRHRARFGLVAFAIAGCCALTAAAPAAAQISDEPTASEVRVLGESATVTEDGYLQVDPQVGPPLTTHGPDPVPSGTRASARVADFEPGGPERAPLCAAENRLQVIYAHAGSAADRSAAMRPQIQAAVRRMNAVLSEESIASGGPTADYRVACDGAGAIEVPSIATNGASFDAIVSAARNAGFVSKSSDYLIFFDGQNGGACGIASYSDDERLVPENRNNSGGGYGAVYGPCWNGETPMHEAGHLMGAVQYSAPHSTGTGGHCWEEVDVMCYSPDGGDLHQFGVVVNCDGQARFDCGYDDYFDSAPEAGEYLESHWNLGSPMNRSLAFGGVSVTTPGTNTDGPGGNGSDSLGSGGKKAGASGARGDWRHFKVKVRRNKERLRVRLFGSPHADLALFVRRGRKPTRDVYECRRTMHNRHATCRVGDAKPGRWYASVLTRGGAEGAGYKIRVKNKRR